MSWFSFLVAISCDNVVCSLFARSASFLPAGPVALQAVEERDDLRRQTVASQPPPAPAEDDDGNDDGVNNSDNLTRTNDAGKPLPDLPPTKPPHKGDLVDVAAQTTAAELQDGHGEVGRPRADGAVGDGGRLEREEREGKELVLLRNVVEKLQREVEGLKSDLQVRGL